jgi:regulation of enolase protein 1 (concanavalin A-like superfamily)
MLEKRGFHTLFIAAALAFAMALPAAAAVLPTDFAGKAIGDGGGSIKDEGNKLTIQGEGADIGDVDQDHFFFVSREVTGDGHITARLNSATGGAEDGGEKVGLMIRADLDPDSAHAMMYESDDNYGLAFRWREAKGDDTQREAGYGFRRFPLWLRIQRTGNQVTGYFSTDGQLWSATNTKTVALGDKANFGLAVSSHEDERLMTTEWESVSVGTDVLVTGLEACGNANGVSLTWQPVKGATGYLVFRGAPNIDQHNVKQDQLVQISKDPVPANTPAYADLDSALQPGARAVYAVAPVMADGKPGPLTIVLAGKSGPPVSPLPGYTVTVIGQHKEGNCAQGSAGASVDPTTGVVTVRGGGHDIWNDGDHYVILSRKLSGNGHMTIQPLDFALGVNATGCACGKGGLILVEKLAARSRFVMASVRPDGLATQWRDGDGIDGSGEHGSSSVLGRDEERAALKAGLLLRVEREGDEVRTLYSVDGGQTFEPITDPVTLEGLANDVEIGVMITTRDRDAPIQNRLGEFQVKIID